jgi:hypothetical protein
MHHTDRWRYPTAGLFAREKTGPLCSSHLHKGPASLFIADILLANAVACPRFEGTTDLGHIRML